VKVKELIEQLKKFNQELDVGIVDGNGECLTGEIPSVAEVFFVDNDFVYFDNEPFDEIKYAFEDEEDPKAAYEKAKKENRIVCFYLEGLMRGG